MATTSVRSVVPHLRRMLGVESPDSTDAALLDRFVRQRDGDAFAVLVQRHGPMVLGVCRRVLGNVHDAEDAFQATFIVLARKAASLSGGGGLANWLYGVAHRTALKARTTAYRRRGRVQPVTELPDTEAPTHETADDLLPHLDAELSRLPDMYRQAVVMCDLCGMTQKDAAKRAGCPEGTLSSRLTRARAMLARRLKKRGIALTGGGLAIALSCECFAGAVAPSLLRSTVEAATRVGSATAVASSKAVALSETVMKSMLLGKLKALATGIGLVGFALFLIVLFRPASEAEGQEKPRTSERPSVPKERLPDGVVMRLGVAERQTADDQIALTPDGKSIVGVRGSKYIRIWDRATGKLRETGELPIEWPRMGNTISSDGRYFVTGSERHDSLILWDLAQKKKVHELVFERGKQHYLLVAFSRDLKRVAAVGSSETRHRVRVWDVESGKEVFAIEKKLVVSPRGPYFSPDSKRLLVSFTSNEEGTYCFDIESGKLIWQNKEYQPGHLIVTPGGRIYPNEPQYPILDADSGKPIDAKPAAWYGKLTLLPNGNTMLATDGLGVNVWDLEKSAQILKLPDAKGPVAMSADGKTLIVSGGRLQGWDLTTGKAIFPDNTDQAHVDEAMALAFDADGKRLFSAGLDATVRVWNLTTGQAERVSKKGDPRPLLPLDLARALSTEIMHASPDGRWQVRVLLDNLSIWDAKTGKAQADLEAVVQPVQGLNGGRILHARINTDGTRVTAILAGSGGAERGFVIPGQAPPPLVPGAVITWNRAGKLIDRRPIDLAGRETFLSPDGRWLLEDGSLIWTPTGTKSHRLEGVGEMGGRLPYVFSPDGGLILGAANRMVVKDGQNWSYPDGMKVWETATGKLVAHFKSDNWASHFWFHPGGRYVAVGQLEGVQVWDLLTGKTIADCKMPERVGSKVGHGCYVACAAISPDARRLATGLPDGSILVWEVKRPDESARPLGAKSLDELWTDLASADAGKAWTAVRKLAATPAESIPFLANRVKPVPNAPADRTGPLIEALDSGEFRQREAAAKKLVELGAKAESALRAAFAASKSAEQARRIEDLLIRCEKIVEPAGGEVRELRAVAVLRLAGTDEAKKVLRELATGVERANLTREARSTLAALNGQ